MVLVIARSPDLDIRVIERCDSRDCWERTERNEGGSWGRGEAPSYDLWELMVFSCRDVVFLRSLEPKFSIFK